MHTFPGFPAHVDWQLLTPGGFYLRVSNIFEDPRLHVIYMTNKLQRSKQKKTLHSSSPVHSRLSTCFYCRSLHLLHREQFIPFESLELSAPSPKSSQAQQTEKHCLRMGQTTQFRHWPRSVFWRTECFWARILFHDQMKEGLIHWKICQAHVLVLVVALVP